MLARHRPFACGAERVARRGSSGGSVAGRRQHQHHHRRRRRHHAIAMPHCHDSLLHRRIPSPSSSSSDRRRLVACASSSSNSGSSSATAFKVDSPARLIQHKTEAYWLYSFLSLMYDHVINPLHWTPDMRTEALQPAQLDRSDLKVVDVGGGTGFCSEGVVKHIRPENITLIDQSPHQLAKARKKDVLKGIKMMEGDAEDLPFATDSFDRYVSAGSIEYWPEPQRGIVEAFRVLKEGGIGCMIGPVRPTFWLSKFFADTWMLFPMESEYREWFERAGFKNIAIKRIGPKWYRGVRRHGLIMGCSVTGVKDKAGPSPLKLDTKLEKLGDKRSNFFLFLLRFLLGLTASCYYVVLPLYMHLKNLVWPKSWAM